MKHRSSPIADIKLVIKTMCISAVIASLTVFPAFSASAEAGGGIRVSDDSLDRGESFFLTISVPPAENADTASVKVIYDDNAFEVTEWTPEIPGSFSNKENGLIAVSAANVERVIDLGGGLELTAALKVKEDASDGIYRFDLTESSFCFFNEETADFDELWEPETRSVTVKVGNGTSLVTYADTSAEEPVTEASTIAASTTAPNAETTLQTAQTAESARTVSDQSDGKIVPLIIIGSLAAVLVIVLIILSKLRK